MVLDQQVSKPSDGVTVRDLIAGLYFTEIRKRAAVNNFVSGSFVGEVVKVLDQVDSQHQLPERRLFQRMVCKGRKQKSKDRTACQICRRTEALYLCTAWIQETY